MPQKFLPLAYSSLLGLFFEQIFDIVILRSSNKLKLFFATDSHVTCVLAIIDFQNYKRKTKTVPTQKSDFADKILVFI